MISKHHELWQKVQGHAFDDRAGEGQRFRVWYERTLASYRHQFGEDPPADSGPCADDRFGDHLKFARVNVGRYWLIPKPTPPFWPPHAGHTLALGGATVGSRETRTPWCIGGASTSRRPRTR